MQKRLSFSHYAMCTFCIVHHPNVMTTQVLHQERQWITTHIVGDHEGLPNPLTPIRNIYQHFSNCGVHHPLSGVTVLNVTAMGLSKLPHLSDMPMLTRIIASENNLSGLADFSGLSYLALLDVSYNRITTCQDLHDTARLESLHLRGNGMVLYLLCLWVLCESRCVVLHM